MSLFSYLFSTTFDRYRAPDNSLWVQALWIRFPCKKLKIV